MCAKFILFQKNAFLHRSDHLLSNVTQNLKYGSGKMRYFEKFSVFLLVTGLFFAGTTGLFADNATAREEFRKGAEKEKAGKYIDAAETFEEAHVQADDPVLKANALMNVARCYRKAQLYGKEFDALQALIKVHISRINFTDVVQRQYEIANLFFKGHRDYFVSWLPFIRKDDRTTELFEIVLENAPCAAPAAEVRLGLGRLYVNNQKPQKAAETFRKVLQLHPETKEAKYAALELANLFVQLAEKGDGDGKYAKEALITLEAFLKKHPNDSETEWIHRAIEKVHSCIAKRYCKLGDFYKESGKKETAERYYALVISDYPNTPEAQEAEKKLSQLDKNYVSSRKPLTKKERQFVEMSLPEEPDVLLIQPDESEGRFLLPVKDLRRNVSAPPKMINIKEEVDEDAL